MLNWGQKIRKGCAAMQFTVSGGNTGAKITVDEIKAQFLDGSGGDGDQPLLASFSFYFDESFVQIKVRNFQLAKLGDSKSATV